MFRQRAKKRTAVFLLLFMTRNRKQTSFSTIIVVNKNQEESKSLRIRTSHLKWMRHYAFALSGVFVALLGSVIFLVNRNNQAEAEKQQLLAKISNIQHTQPAQMAVANEKLNDAGAAKTYIQSIQEKLTKINDYLKKRGLSQLNMKGLGGGNKDADLSANEQYALYDQYLGRLVNNVAFTPMGYPRISSIRSIFGYRNDPFDGERAEYHPGLDFAGQKGDIVKATADGKVEHAGWNNGYGNCIIIKHKNNFQTLYGHLSHIDVKEGQTINTGQVIGRVGSTGHSTGPHLHYEVRVNGKPVNPAKFLTLNSK